MTNEQRYINFCRIFERLISEVEQEKDWVSNKAACRRISRLEYFQRMTELEIRKKTLEEVSKSVLLYLKTEMNF